MLLGHKNSKNHPTSLTCGLGDGSYEDGWYGHEEAATSSHEGQGPGSARTPGREHPLEVYLQESNVKAGQYSSGATPGA